MPSHETCQTISSRMEKCVDGTKNVRLNNDDLYNDDVNGDDVKILKLSVMIVTMTIV